jgi:arsenate reductase
MKTRVLFLCTHNSARSQMAEGLLQQLGENLRCSALARSKRVCIHSRFERCRRLRFDYVITVCDRANEQCPIFPSDPERIQWSITDPSSVAGDETARLKVFRRVRDEIQGRIRTLITLAERRTSATAGR